MVYSRLQKLAAEFLGTFALVLLSAGVICANQLIRDTNSGAPPSGVLDSLAVALAYGLAFAAMSAALTRVSGAHFNPAVTIGFWVTRRFSTFDTVTYWLAQLGGAIAAAYLLRYLIPDMTWQAVALGTPDLASGVTRSPGMLIEGLASFFVTFAIFAAALSTKANERGSSGALSALAGGLAIVVGSLFAGPFTGGAMNPSRAFGPALASHHWTNHGVYWVGPLGGGVLAAWVYNALFVRPSGPPSL